MLRDNLGMRLRSDKPLYGNMRCHRSQRNLELLLVQEEEEEEDMNVSLFIYIQQLMTCVHTYSSFAFALKSDWILHLFQCTGTKGKRLFPTWSLAIFWGKMTSFLSREESAIIKKTDHGHEFWVWFLRSKNPSWFRRTLFCMEVSVLNWKTPTGQNKRITMLWAVIYYMLQVSFIRSWYFEIRY